MARVFITGSTDGLGLAAARSLLSTKAIGSSCTRGPPRVLAVADLISRSAEVVVGDLSSAAETRGVADHVNPLGRMDAVIHNAGTYRRAAPRPDGGRPRHRTRGQHARAVHADGADRAPRPADLPQQRPASRGGGFVARHRLDPAALGRGPGLAESKLYVAALALAGAGAGRTFSSNVVDPGWVRTRMGGAGAPVDLDTGQRTQAWLAVSKDAAAGQRGILASQRQAQPA